MPLLVILFGAALAANAARPPPRPLQFDLSCTGMTELQLYDFGGDGPMSLPTFQKRVKPEPWTGHFRVDLINASWCEDKCTEVYSPAMSKPELVVMVQTDIAGVRQRTAFETPDGTFLMLRGGGTSIEPTRAKCTVGAFTPIPTSAMKIGGKLNTKAEPYPPPSF